MSDRDGDDQIVEGAMLDEIADEDLEAAAGAAAGAVPTLLGTYCFGCPPVTPYRRAAEAPALI